MRLTRFATGFMAASILAPAAMADDAAGVQVLIDMQDPAQISKTFCVQESKLFSVDAQICVSGTVSLTCKAVDPTDASKGVKWVVADEKNRCRQ